MATKKKTSKAGGKGMTEEVIARHDRYMTRHVGRWPVVMVRGEGCYLFDAEGKRYLDLFAGFGGSILGHCQADLVEAVREQAGRLWHVGNLLHTEPQTVLAEAIAGAGFGGLSFFSHCGADANEAALKLVRLYGKARPGKAGGYRYKVVSALNSFHGRLFGTMMATGQEKVRAGYEPWLEGFAHVPFDDLGAMKEAVDKETVAVMVEPIQGEGGIHMPGKGYLKGLRELCDENDLVLIFDEVWTGCGRTGKYFAYQHWGVEPDVMTLAKGVGGGMAVGVMCAKERVARYFEPGVNHGVAAHGTTLGGNCLAMAAAGAVFRVMERDGLLKHAEQLGGRTTARLEQFAKKCAAVKAVRGKGLFLGIELDEGAAGCWFKSGNEVVKRCMERGVLINVTKERILRFAPPINIKQVELDAGLDVIEEVIKRG